ncbi:MAG TPA: ribbon-helix-helix domain-containing protein [Stellaceae bacterium]|nr:ribbon-helix-helix domain-containing protein [Stellaceae bacterium]
MCRIYASQDPNDYEPITRSIRLNGLTTSIRLEAAFWAILDELAESEGTTTGRFVSTLHDEVLIRHGETPNFTSMLRVTCLLYVERKGVPAVATADHPRIKLLHAAM